MNESEISQSITGTFEGVDVVTDPSTTPFERTVNYT